MAIKAVNLIRFARTNSCNAATCATGEATPPAQQPELRPKLVETEEEPQETPKAGIGHVKRRCLIPRPEETTLVDFLELI